MPYKDPAVQREYARQWHARRRATFFFNKACSDCQSTDDLQLHHVDRATKIHHNVWSWSEARREAEIAKCIVLCEACHREHHAVLRRSHGIKRYGKGCRCDICRAAKRESNARYQAKRKNVVSIDFGTPERFEEEAA